MPIKVFVIYSHRDVDFLADDSLLGYLKGLEREEIEFWWDERIVTGDKWDDEIKRRIKETDIALVLVSQWFLDSAYCTDVEISGFLEKCRSQGLVVFPIILSSCEWDRHEWLRTRQFLPGGKKTVRKDFMDRGSLEEFFLQVREDLRKQIERIREAKNAARAFEPSTTMSGKFVSDVNSFLRDVGVKNQVTNALVDLLEEFSDTHSEVVKHVDPIITLTKDPKQFESEFHESYRTYRKFRFDDSLRAARTKCSEVSSLQAKLLSAMPRLKDTSLKSFQELVRSFEDLANYDYVLGIWEGIYSLVDGYCEKANFYLRSGHISEAITVMENFRNSVDKSYRESLDALKNMEDVIIQLRTMYS